MDIPQQVNDIINQVADKNVRGVALMANNLVSGKSELAEKVSDLQNIYFNLNERWVFTNSIPVMISF